MGVLQELVDMKGVRGLWAVPTMAEAPRGWHSQNCSLCLSVLGS